MNMSNRRWGFDFEDLPIPSEQEADAILRNNGYDPEQVGKEMAAFARKVSQQSELRQRFRVSFALLWYDLWVGLYIDRARRRLYFCLLPCCVIRVDFSSKG